MCGGGGGERAHLHGSTVSTILYARLMLRPGVLRGMAASVVLLVALAVAGWGPHRTSP